MTLPALSWLSRLLTAVSRRTRAGSLPSDSQTQGMSLTALASGDTADAEQQKALTAAWLDQLGAPLPEESARMMVAAGWSAEDATALQGVLGGLVGHSTEPLVVWERELLGDRIGVLAQEWFLEARLSRTEVLAWMHAWFASWSIPGAPGNPVEPMIGEYRDVVVRPWREHGRTVAFRRWLALPDGLGAAAFTAGLTIEEAEDQAQRGVLTEASLAVLASLRGTPLPSGSREIVL